MIKNKILQKRMCQLVAQTFAVSTDFLMAKVEEIGIEKVIEILESSDQNKPNFHNS